MRAAAHPSTSTDSSVRRLVACAHCGLETALDDPATWVAASRTMPEVGARASSESENATPVVFCCHGCMGAYAMIHELGLDDFYAIRGPSQMEPSPVRGVRRSDVLADLDAAGVPVERSSDGLCKVRLSVDGLHCAACTWLIESMQPNMPGLKSARVRMSDGTIELLYDPEVTQPHHVAQRLAKLGYALGPIDNTDDDSGVDIAFRREHWIGMATAFFLAANAMWVGVSLYAGEASGMAPAHATFLRWVGALLGLLASLFPGRVFFRSAWESLRAGVPHVDVPVALGLAVGTIGSVVGAAFGSGHVYFDSLASLVFLLRVGRYIQFRAQYRTGLSIAKLLRMNSVVAQRLAADGTRQAVPSKRLRALDLVEVLAGQMVPADGVVVEGKSLIQTALITGESHPVAVQVGSELVGGAVNLYAPLTLRVTATGDESRMGRLSEMVRNATAHRTPLIRLADKIGGYFVLMVLGLSVATFWFWWWASDLGRAIEHTVALLTIACPCALALAAPLVITVALGRAARDKIWIRDGNCLEQLAAPGMLWFDKTGTLTFGDLRVLGWSGSEASLRQVAALEQQSNHPAARAILAHAVSEFPEWDLTSHRVEDVEQAYGRGILGRVDGCWVSVGSAMRTGGEAVGLVADGVDRLPASPSSLGVHQRVDAWVDGIHAGAFLLGDRERPDAVAALLGLQRRGWKIGILSGDRASVVESVSVHLRSQGLRLEESLGDCTPERKLEVIQASKERFRTTVMVGDGINDAAALAAADVGIAIRGGGEACLRHAPIYIPSNQLGAIVRLMDASRNTVRAIHRCFVASLLYNAITISLAVSGWIHPLIAALFMPLSGLTVLTMAMTARTFPSAERSS